MGFCNAVKKSVCLLLNVSATYQSKSGIRYVTKDEIYDPVASSLYGQVFQGGCRQREVKRGGGGGGRLEI